MNETHRQLRQRGRSDVNMQCSFVGLVHIFASVWSSDGVFGVLVVQYSVIILIAQHSVVAQILSSAEVDIELVVDVCFLNPKPSGSSISHGLPFLKASSPHYGYIAFPARHSIRLRSELRHIHSRWQIRLVDREVHTVLTVDVCLHFGVILSPLRSYENHPVGSTCSSAVSGPSLSTVTDSISTVLRHSIGRGKPSTTIKGLLRRVAKWWILCPTGTLHYFQSRNKSVESVERVRG